MPYDIQSQKGLIYGRAPDLATLRARTETSGLTVVLGRPQQGKTWLLLELARSLDDSGQVAVGFGRSYGETADLMLRAVQDLYARWLTQAGTWGRVKAALEKPQGWLAGPVKFVFDQLIKAVAGDNAVTDAMIRQVLDALIAADKSATGAAGFLPTLKYDQARDLVAAVHRLSGRRVVLMMDQYQESPDPEGEAKTLRAFLADCDQWPPCHILLALREQEAAADVMRALVRERPGRGTIYPLGGMALKDDAETRRRLLADMRKHLPALTKVDDAAILGWVEDYPGVLYRWRDMDADDAVALIAERARDAHQGRYPEIERILATLEGNDLSLAIRLAFYPTVENAGDWEALQTPLLDGLDACGLDRLCRARLIEGIKPPTFGHARRREVAGAWLLAQAPTYLSQTIKATIPRLAEPITDVIPEVEPYARALVGLTPLLDQAEASLSQLSAACIQAAQTLFQTRVPVGGALDAACRPPAAPVPAWAAPLLAMGLFNTLCHAKDENDLPRRDALLEDLRGLAATHPDDAAVREGLAAGLVNTLCHATDENDRPRRDALLDELRALASAHPTDAAVRDQLAMGLAGRLLHARQDNAPQAIRDALTAELTPLLPHLSDDTRVLIRKCLGL